MGKRSRIFASIAVAAIMTSASPASAQQGTPAYNTALYSDATYQTQVGYIVWDGCDDDTPHYHLVGTYSRYGIDEHVGYCSNGQMQPL
jgi:hypothetical protein